MSEEVAFSIPGRPRAWERTADWTDPRSGRRIKVNPKEMRAHQRLIAQIGALAMRGKPPLTGPLKLEVLAVYAIPRSWPAEKRQAAMDGQVWKTTVPDIDNLAKIIADAMNRIAYGDDAQIVRLACGKRYGSPERTDVRISRLEVLDDHSARSRFKAHSAARAGQSSLDLSPAIPCNMQSRERG